MEENKIEIELSLKKETKQNPNEHATNKKASKTEQSKPGYKIEIKINNDKKVFDVFEQILDYVFEKIIKNNNKDADVKISWNNNDSSLGEYENSAFSSFCELLQEEIDDFLKSKNYKTIKDKYNKALEKTKTLS